jgi:hypothetical protein
MQKLLPWRVWNFPRRSADVRRGAGAMGGAGINCSRRMQLGVIDILLSVALTRFCAVKACGQLVREYSCLFGKL